MPRKRMDNYVKSPPAEEARELAQAVFKLKEDLGISYPQMAEETGLEVSSLTTVKSSWVNGRRNHNSMYLSMANGLVTFWNKHLTGKRKVSKKKVQAPKAVSLVTKQHPDVLALLIQKVGLSEARKLLAARGKEKELDAYLESLTPAQLADLV